ncbi:MAG: hypothetical protein QOJ63_2204 [Solirubrobacteraceae bacterium]|nr:hypothetical protein [Solirubrobacteraceae bacterium]
MLTITIIFALLVALWGFPGAIAMLAKQASSRAHPAPGDDAVSQPRAPRPAASAGR